MSIASGINFHGFGNFIIPLSEEFGWSYATISIVFSLARLESGMIGPVEGWAVDRLGPRRLMLIGLPLMGIGYIAMSQINSLAAFLFVYVFLVLFGFGQGVHALNRAMLGEYFGNSHYATLGGILSSATTPLAAAGPIYAGWTADNSGYGTVVFTFMFLYAFSAILYWNCRRPSLPTMPSQVEPALPGQPNAG